MEHPPTPDSNIKYETLSDLNEDDLSQLSQLFERYIADDKKFQLDEKSIREAVNDPETGFLCVARNENGKIIGFIGGEKVNDEQFHVNLFAVEENSRNSMVALRLLGQLRQFLRNNEIRRVTAKTNNPKIQDIVDEFNTRIEG